jgi:uncharacterized protein (TIGR02246 family)
MKTLLLTLLLATPALAADLKTELTAQIQKWAADFNAHNPAALAAHYADDVQFIYAFDGQEGATKKGIEQFYVQSFKATPDVAVKLISYDVVLVSPNVAYGAGVWEDTLTGPDGKKVTIPTHSSEIFVKKGGKWLVRVDHASFVPPPQAPPPAPGKAVASDKKPAEPAKK